MFCAAAARIAAQDVSARTDQLIPIAAAQGPTSHGMTVRKRFSARVSAERSGRKERQRNGSNAKDGGVRFARSPPRRRITTHTRVSKMRSTTRKSCITRSFLETTPEGQILTHAETITCLQRASELCEPHLLPEQLNLQDALA